MFFAGASGHSVRPQHFALKGGKMVVLLRIANFFSAALAAMSVALLFSKGNAFYGLTAVEFGLIFLALKLRGR